MEPEGRRPTIDSERLEDLEGPWLRLFQEAGAPPFAHPAWVRAWLDTLGDPATAVFLAVRRGDDLIGVAPLALGPTAATPVGDPDVFDYSPVLASPGNETAVRLALLEWLREDLTAEYVEWGVPGELDPGIGEAARDLGWSLNVEPLSVAPRAELPGDFETYLSGLSKKDRHELRRKTRKFEDAGEITTASTRSGPEFQSALEALTEMMALSHDEKGEFLLRYGDFFRTAANALAKHGLALITTVFVDATPAARVLSFESCGVSYLYNSGYDPRFANVGAGLISKAYVLRDAIERGLHTFDFLRGDEDYKRHLGGLAKPVITATFRQH